MHGRVRLDEHDIERVRNNRSRDLCRVPWWQLVRGWRGPTRCMHLRGRLLLTCGSCHDVRWDILVVRGLPVRVRV